MSILRPMVYNGGQVMAINSGDVIDRAEVFPATIATNAITITAAILASNFIQRTTTGAGTDTIDTAANIISGISAGLGTVGVAPGSTWRVRWHQNAAFAITVQATANTGVTVTQGTVNASSSKEFLVTVVNGTPAASVTAIHTNASAVLTGMNSTETALLTPGMVVTNSVGGLQGATILSVQPGTGVTMSTTASSTVTAEVAFNFSPVITLQGLGQGLI